MFAPDLCQFRPDLRFAFAIAFQLLLQLEQFDMGIAAFCLRGGPAMAQRFERRLPVAEFAFRRFERCAGLGKLRVEGAMGTNCEKRRKRRRRTWKT